MVGAEGFEPSTICLKGSCSTRLSYTPKKLRIHFDKVYNITKVSFWQENFLFKEIDFPPKKWEN